MIQILLHYLWPYLAIINVATFLTFGIDKWKARQSKWRIREASLLLHHKTLHTKFRYGVPAILIIHLIIIGALLSHPAAAH